MDLTGLIEGEDRGSQLLCGAHYLFGDRLEASEKAVPQLCWREIQQGKPLTMLPVTSPTLQMHVSSHCHSTQWDFSFSLLASYETKYHEPSPEVCWKPAGSSEVKVKTSCSSQHRVMFHIRKCMYKDFLWWFGNLYNLWTLYEIRNCMHPCQTAHSILNGHLFVFSIACFYCHVGQKSLHAELQGWQRVVDLGILLSVEI